MDRCLVVVLCGYLLFLPCQSPRDGNGVPGWLYDREVVVDGQPVCIPDAVFVLRRRAQVSARSSFLGNLRCPCLAQHIHFCVLGLFGIFLLYTGGKMFFHDDNHMSDPSQNVIVRWFRKLYPVTGKMHGDNFFVVENGRRMATPLFVTLLVIETTDVAFAVDSIPAVFSVSRDPFIVLTSNIFAILGLRALYFALAAVVKYFRYLKYGLGVILIFVGIKMLLAMNEYINSLGELMGLSLNVPHIEVPTPVSLAIIFGVLLLSMLSSVLLTGSKGKQS